MAFIFFLSAQSDPDVLSPIAFEGDDTLAHLALYVVLGLLLWRAALQAGGRFLQKRPGRWAFGIGWAYGFSDEIHQAFVPVRTPGLGDVMIDGLGVALGVTAGWLIFSRRAKRQRDENADHASQ